MAAQTTVSDSRNQRVLTFSLLTPSLLLLRASSLSCKFWPCLNCWTFALLVNSAISSSCLASRRLYSSAESCAFLLSTSLWKAAFLASMSAWIFSAVAASSASFVSCWTFVYMETEGVRSIEETAHRFSFLHVYPIKHFLLSLDQPLKKICLILFLHLQHQFNKELGT